MYSPNGRSGTSERSRALCLRVKHGRLDCLRHCATRVRDQVQVEQRLAGIFLPRGLLVPVPQASMPGGPWVARKLAWALLSAGLGEAVWSGLSRRVGVEKSASCWMWNRPTVERHFESLAVDRLDPSPARMLIVDDVVTKGRTLVAAALRLQEAFPNTHITAYALIRTLGFVPDVTCLIDACEGEISWDGRDARRDP